jgi:hypothetical protein
MTATTSSTRPGQATVRSVRVRQAGRSAAVAALAVLAVGGLAGCGERDDPVVTVSPTPVTPSSTPEPATPEPTIEVPVTTDKPTDRQTIPPQN